MDQQIINGIKEVRAIKGLTQNDMASILGVNRATYINIEAGKRDLTVNELNKICESLNMGFSDIIDPSFLKRNNSEEKFKQMYLYLVNNFFSDHGVPKTKLAKILYLIDFSNFYEKLESMSNIKYIRRDYGPVADPFFSLTDKMYMDGIINIEPLEYAQMIKPAPTKDESYSLLSDDDKRLIEKICSYWKDKRTQEIVNFTHSQKPWKECRDGEEIPYSLIIQEEPDHVYAPTTA